MPPPPIRSSPPNGSPRISTIPTSRSIDASFKMPGVLPLPKDDYLASHIPGAVFFDVDAVSDHSNPLPHMFPSAEQFGRDVGGLGIGNDDTVVLYDSGGWVAAPRAWWMFLSFGKDVRMLNGGLKKWVAEGRKVESGRGDAEAGDVQGGVRCAAHAQHAAAGRQSRQPRRAGDRCPRQRALSGQGGRAAGGPALRPYPRQPAACPTTTCSMPRPAR